MTLEAPPAPSSAASPPLTIVCCIEAGALEGMTLRMLMSLRRFGGVLAEAPVLAVTPRRGPPLTRAVRAALDSLHARHISFAAAEPYAWNNFMNKPHALLAGEEHAATPALCWLDSDVLIAAPPEDLILPAEAAFTACPSDKNVGSAGADDANEPFWREACALFGMRPDDLPWVTTCAEGIPIRWYFNSGVFTVRRGAGFAQAFLEDCRRLLDARIAARHAGIFFIDQIALGITALRLGLTVRPLPYSHNLPLGSRAPLPLPGMLERAHILHHHDMLWPEHFSAALKLLKPSLPHMADFLASLGPLRTERSLAARLFLKLLKYRRGRALARHMAACRVY